MKYKTKKILKTIGLVLVGALAFGLLLHATGTEIENPFDKNDEKNLINFKDDSYILSQQRGYGVDIDVEDGEITLSGEATQADTVKVVELTLDAGTYKITGLNKCDKAGFNMSVKNGSSILAYSGIDESDTVEIDEVFELTEETTVTVWLSWAKDHNFNAFPNVFGTKITPVISLVKAAEASTETEAAA